MKTIPSRHVVDTLIKLGCAEAKIFPRDTSVALLDEKGVALFGKRFASWLWRANVGNSGDESFDCDDFAGAAAFFARLDHATWHGNVDAGVAFGEVWYVDSDTGPHAVNFSAHSENDQIKIKLWEPQVQWNENGTRRVSMREVPLSRVSLWLFCSF